MEGTENKIISYQNTDDFDIHQNIINLNKSYKFNRDVCFKIRVFELIKRISDFICSLLGIIILSPFLIIVSFLVKIQNEGSIIFSQERIGKDGKLFNIYKFRSMKQEAPDISDRDFIDSDIYITKIGKIIRKTSIDELPQLINILKGDMSFVGPRPFILNEGEINILRAQQGVHTITPGLTGWAQVSDRNSNNHNHKLDLDIYYLENRSIWLDIKIFVKTFFVSLGR